MDQVRIVKEMRNATRRETSDRSTELPRPRYMVWENVPGAFSSNKGEDFRAVLEEICQVCDPEASIPRPAKNKWLSSGTILGEGYSVAWRTFDAQYWGVPQRRRRIYLVADFGDHTAPEILFEQESLSGHIETSREAEEGVATDAERSSGASGECGVKGCRTTAGGSDVTSTLFAAYGTKWNGNSGAYTGDHFVLEGAEGCSGATGELVLNDQGGSVMGVSYGVTGTLRAQEHGHQPIVCYSLQGNMIGRADHNGPQGSGVNEDVSFTLNTVDRHAVCYNGESITSPTNRQNPKPGDPCHTLGTDSRNYVCYGVDTYNQSALIETASTLRSASGGDSKAVVCYGISSHHSNSMKSSNPHSGVYVANTSKTIDQNGGNPACNQGGIAVVQSLYENHPSDSRVTYSTQSYSEVKESEQGASLKASGGMYGGGSENYVVQQVVRRLTPLECERLQGFPDYWTLYAHENKTVSDTQRYKALGNSFAVPNAFFVISRCVEQLQD